MPFSSENLLKELDTPVLIDWALELKNGKEAYAFLMEVLGSSELNVNQTRNGLRALFVIRGHGNRSDVLQKFVEVAGHPNKAVRSMAVQLAIGLVQFAINTETVPLAFSEAQEKAIREAVAQGVTTRITSLAKRFFS
jgi:hypothetical protein